jgi:hypothetical protein
MDVNIYTVCEDSTGGTSKQGTICPVLNADGNVVDYYSFYATRTASDQTEDTQVVKLVMPVAGKNGGLFRFPQVGDKVLVGRLGDTTLSNGLLSRPTGDYILIGYMPDETTTSRFYSDAATDNTDAYDPGIELGYLAEQKNPASMADFKTDEGVALRYNWKLKKDENGKDIPTKIGGMTEIGFYRKKAKWPNTTPKDRKGPSLEFDLQDTVNIQSTGDIESRADNYQLLKAKRFEILVNTQELSPELRFDNVNADEWQSDQAPVGDSPLDDPMIHSGDMHIRAGRNIVIKAANEIRLQVGRTVVVINDGGFSVVTQKSNSGVGLSCDTSLNMNPRTGVTIGGQKVTLSGINGFSLGDAWGGSIASSLGGIDIKGMFIKQSNINSLASGVILAENTIEAAKNIVLMSMLKTKSDVWQEGIARAAWIIDGLKTLVDDLGLIYPLFKDRCRTDPPEAAADTVVPENPTNPSVPGVPPDLTSASKGTVLDQYEPIEALLMGINLVLQITNAVYTIVDTTFSIMWQEDLADVAQGATSKYTPSKKSEKRDMLIAVATSIDSGLIALVMDIATGVCMKKGVPGAVADLRLRSSGDIVLKAGRNILQYGESKEIDATPVSFAVKTTKNAKDAITAAVKVLTDVAKLTSSGRSTWHRVKPWLEKL